MTRVTVYVRACDVESQSRVAKVRHTAGSQMPLPLLLLYTFYLSPCCLVYSQRNMAPDTCTFRLRMMPI
jgi:hypothetical protein